MVGYSDKITILELVPSFLELITNELFVFKLDEKIVQNQPSPHDF